MKTLHLYRFTLRRSDGTETLVSSHQPAARWMRMSRRQLAKISASILSHRHWKQFLNGQAGTVIAHRHTTSGLLAPGLANALSLFNSSAEIIELA